MFEHRFLSALAISLGTIALTVASAAIVEGSLSSKRERACGIEPVAAVGVSVVSCEGPYDVEDSRVWAVVTHESHCVSQPKTPRGRWHLACDNQLELTIDAAEDGSWTSCSLKAGENPRYDVSSSCSLSSRPTNAP